jgi:hypothetical protein
MSEKMTVTEAAKFCDKSPNTIRYWIQFKELKAKTVPAKGFKDRMVIDREDLEEFILKMREGR